MKKLLILLTLNFLALNFLGQELNCQVKINYSQLQGTANKQIFDQLEKAIYDDF